MPRPLRVGVQLPETEREVRFAELVAMARAAEEVGFDSIWLGDHLLYRGDGEAERGPWDVWTMLAALAVVTERVTLGPLVACTAFHQPGMIARMAAAIDEVSGGRLVLGLGCGWNGPEFEAFGLPFDRLVSRFEESFEIIRRLLAGEHVSLDGRYYRVDEAVVLPAPVRRVPLMTGTNGPRMLAITLPHVEHWNTWYDWYGNTVQGFAARNVEVTAAAERAGVDPAGIDRSACVLCVVDPNAAERPAGPAAPPVPGDAEPLAAHLRALARAGADEAILVVEPITEPSIRALAAALALLDR